jgi:hypothetical protein
VPAEDPAAQRAGGRQIPTAIVSIAGQEIGRIVTDDAWNRSAVHFALGEELSPTAPPLPR